IHRDLKPSNILVSAEDDRPTPKIIDFGVAKAISQPLTERTLFTEDSHLLGTPEYMSPEQAEMASEDIDTRSDIYSLGVLLYVLLAGILPYDSKTFRQGGIEGIRKIIRETDPKTPSTRLTKLGEEAKKLAESRRSEITALARCLRKELEWIPLKAMRKDRAERYRSASELADDVENYLRGAPLIAGPPGTGYRLKKFVQRNCVSVGGIAAVIVVLVAGVVVSTIFAIGQARALAENQLITDFLENDVLGSADEAKVNEATVGYVLDAASKDLGKFNDKPLIQARLCKTLGGIYRNLGEYEKADQHISRAIEIYRQYRGEAHPDTLAAMSLIGWVYIKQGRYHDMERLYTKLLQIRQHVYGVEHPIGVMHGLAVAYYYLGKYQEAESLFEEMLQTYQNETPFLVHIKANLAIVYTLQGRYEKAEPLFVETLGVDWLGDPYTAELANMYREQGRYDKAEPLLVTALETQRQRRGDEHFHTVSCMDCFVRLYVDQDRYEEAETLFNEALPIARHRMRPDHPVTLRLVNARAVLHAKQKQYDQAEKLFNEALDGRQRELGDDHPDTLETMNDIGVLRRAQQRYEEAESLLRQALDGRQRKLGPDHPACFESMHELAVLYLRQARYEEAEPLLLDTFHGRETKLGPEHPDTLDSLKELVNLYEALSKPDEAAKWRAKLPGPDTTGEQ
ncbi:MAG: hypothetical protein A2Y77_11895, partial [Planctomycetes bacterium RBG_13_62_9]